VTESEWLACTDPKPMLEFLSGKVSDRKLRLFGVACCRRVWHVLTDGRTRTATEVAETYVDGAVGRWELEKAHKDACDAASASTGPPAAVAATFCGTNLSYKDASMVASNCSVFAAQSISSAWNAEPVPTEREAQSLLLLDIIGPLLFRPVTVSPAWLSPQVVALAQAAYDERELPAGHLDLARLAVLADALEDAGCTDAGLLGHLRGPGPHVRGCWAVDLLLGKA
jgi:hypothetical protein